MELTDEFVALIGLPSEVAEFDAAAGQVELNAGSQASAGRSGAAGSERQELQAAANFAGGSLDAVLTDMSGQAEPVIKSVEHVANHIKVRDRSAHGPAILQFKTGAAALVLPHQGNYLTSPPRTETFQLHRGDTM